MGRTSKVFTCPDLAHKVLKNIGLQEDKLLTCKGRLRVSVRPCFLYCDNKSEELCVSDNNTQGRLKVLLCYGVSYISLHRCVTTQKHNISSD
jgi:hypothetical protein